MMNLSEQIKLINQIERDFPVDEWVIDGLHVWPLIRLELKFKLFKYYHSEKIRKTSFLEKNANLFSFFQMLANLFKYGYACILDLKNNGNLNNEADVIFLTYSLHRSLFMNRWHDRFCEPFVDGFRSLGLKSLVLELEESGQFNYEYHIPRYGPSAFIQFRLDFIKIKNRLFKFKKPCHDMQMGKFSDFVEFLKHNYSHVICPDFKKLQYQTKVIIEMSDYFKRIFHKTRPSLGFVADYYSSLAGLAFNLACRRAGIHPVDIQHGFAADYHASYARWNKVPDEGYELLPSVFWRWSSEEADIILEWNKKVANFHRPFVGGNLWLNLWNNENNQTVKFYDKLILQNKAKVDKRVFILYTFDSNYCIPEWIFSAMKQTANFSHWMIRIHPSQLKEKEHTRNLFKEHNIINYELNFINNYPLPSLLRHVDLHVTATSSCIQEASYFNVTSVVTHIDAVELYPQLIASGIAVKAFSVDELVTIINSKFKIEKNSKVNNPVKETSNEEIIKEFLQTIKNN